MESDRLACWQVHQVPENTADTQRIVFLDERFFILGDAGLLLQSQDGVNGFCTYRTPQGKAFHLVLDD